MATVVATDYSIATNGDIRYTGTTTNNTVIEFHRWLGDLMDNALATGNDLLDITDATASERSTDNIITLKAPFNIDDTLAQHLFDGSIIQGTGGTEVIYEGILVFAAAGMRLEIVQNGAVATNFWTTGLNADAANGISHRFMLKVRTAGADIDGRRLIGQTREFGFTYSEFKINGTSRGNNVLALTYATDLNNQTAAATVATWTTITNTTVGYKLLDVNNDTVNEAYYSEWNRDTFTINQFYERMKWVTRRGTSEIIYPVTTGLNGELFRGITHELPVGLVAQTGTFSAVEAISWTGGTGRLFAVNSTTAARQMWLQLRTGVAPSAALVITGGTSAATATTNANTIATTVLSGTGSVITITFAAQAVLPYPAGTTFTVAGCIPTAYNGTYVSTGGTTTTATAAGTATGAQTQAGTIVGVVVERTLSFPFIGQSTGSAIIGAYGIGIETADLSASDKLTDLTNTLRVPPNNVTFTVSGLVSGEDRVLVAPLGREFAWDTEGGTPPFLRGDTLTYTGGTAYLSFLRDDGTSGRMQIRLLTGVVPTNGLTITGTSGATGVVRDPIVASEDPRQLTLKTTLNGVTTLVVCNQTIPTDTPPTSTGTGVTIRIQMNTGLYRNIAYTSYAGDTFTIGSTDFTSDPATGGTTEATANSIFIAYIDKLATATSASFTGVYSADRSLFIRVRDGAATPIKTFETTGTLGSAGGSATAIRTSDA